MGVKSFPFSWVCPQKVALGIAASAGAMPLSDRGVKGVRVEIRYGFACFCSLGGEVLASPCDVVEITWVVSTVVTCGGDRVVDASKLDLVVAPSTPGNVDVALVFLGEPFGACFGDLVINFSQTFVEVFVSRDRSLAASLGGCGDQGGKELKRSMYKRDSLLLPLRKV